ncbi:hypothetical protein [Erythrobacter sp. YT30]|uniref:hypothetical protein n=1 Tax=Erythrobacter sp. YT30 TaxID=1735012 RepID=UPI000A66F45F|nr:hypothetical protein [Erythrobacter sp. YT30]
MAERKLIGGDLADIQGDDLQASAMENSAPSTMPLGGTRTQAMQRLQAGLLGIGTMILLVGLASIIGTQAELAEQAVVPDAAPTTEPTEAPSQVDPLADAGIVPDIPAEPEETEDDGGLKAPLFAEDGKVPDTPDVEPDEPPQ